MRWLVVGLLLLAGCGGAPTAAPAPDRSLPPVLLAVGGRVVVTDLDAVRLTPTGDHCVALGRYADVAAGARVSLSGTRGSLAAVTQLGQGELRNGRSGAPAGCSFAFSTSNVPNRHPAFLVRVGDQRPVRVEPRELSNGTATIRLPR